MERGVILRRALMWDFVLGVGLASIVSALAGADEVGFIYRCIFQFVGGKAYSICR